MTQMFNFRLVSPEAEIVNMSVAQVGVPGVEGDFGVRAGHMPLISSLRPGVVSVAADLSQDSGSMTRFFITGGFANVNGTECTVLAENAVDVLTLNSETIEADIAVLKGRLQSSMDDVTSKTVQAELMIAQARLQAVQKV